MRLFDEDMKSIISIYFNECHEERWVHKQGNSTVKWDNKQVCRRCYRDLKDGIVPLFSHRNNMVSLLISHNTYTLIQFIATHTTNQVPKLAPSRLRSMSALTKRIVSPAAHLQKIYCHKVSESTTHVSHVSE